MMRRSPCGAESLQIPTTSSDAQVELLFRVNRACVPTPRDLSTCRAHKGTHTPWAMFDSDNLPSKRSLSIDLAGAPHLSHVHTGVHLRERMSRRTFRFVHMPPSIEHPNMCIVQPTSPPSKFVCQPAAAGLLVSPVGDRPACLDSQIGLSRFSAVSITPSSQFPPRLFAGGDSPANCKSSHPAEEDKTQKPCLERRHTTRG